MLVCIEVADIEVILHYMCVWPKFESSLVLHARCSCTGTARLFQIRDFLVPLCARCVIRVNVGLYMDSSSDLESVSDYEGATSPCFPLPPTSSPLSTFASPPSLALVASPPSPSAIPELPLPPPVPVSSVSESAFEEYLGLRRGGILKCSKHKQPEHLKTRVKFEGRLCILSRRMSSKRRSSASFSAEGTRAPSLEGKGVRVASTLMVLILFPTPLACRLISPKFHPFRV